MKKLSIQVILCLILVSCKATNTEYTYPKSWEDEEMERMGSMFDNFPEGNNLFTFNKNNNNDKIIKSSINEIAWKAALDTVSFMPLVSSDAVGGVIITDWYHEPNNISERYKLTIIISGPQLSASAVKVNVNKQVKKGGEWLNNGTSATLAREIENKIFLKAKNLKKEHKFIKRT